MIFSELTEVLLPSSKKRAESQSTSTLWGQQWLAAVPVQNSHMQQ